jgi:hypothetical protein
LEVLGRIVFERLAGLGIDALGPVRFLDVLSGLEELPVEPVEGVFEAVAPGMGQDLAVLAVDLGVDDDVAAGLVIVAIVIRRVLVEPPDLAAGGIEGDRARRIEIVAGTIGGVVGGNRVAGAPIGEVGDRISRVPSSLVLF